MPSSATRLDIYNYPRRLELALRNLKQNSKVSETNRQRILGFHEIAVAEGLSKPRLIRYINILSRSAELLGSTNFTDAKRDDIVSLVAKIESSSVSDWTKQSYKVVLRKFYKWLRHSRGYPREVSWIRVAGRIRGNGILPSELLTEDDVKRLGSAATNARDRALVLALYDSACRIGELLSMRIRDVEFDRRGTVLLVAGKTGTRRVRVIMSSSAIAGWLNVHPGSGNPDSPLWVDLNHASALSYEAARSILQRLASKVSVGKSVRPHMFRHSRATFLSKHFSDAQMDEYLGWVHGSKMHQIYYHLTGRDIDPTLFAMYGLATDEEEGPTLKPRPCPRCQEVCDPLVDYCPRCGSPIDPTRIQEVDKERDWADSIMTDLLEDPETQGFLVRKIREPKLSGSM